MAAPTRQELSPYAKYTLATARGVGEFWQLVGADTFIVYEGVPHELAVNIQQAPNGQLDTAIALQLAAYPKRVSG
jgi:hypothetical protein